MAFKVSTKKNRRAVVRTAPTTSSPPLSSTSEIHASSSNKSKKKRSRRSFNVLSIILIVVALAVFSVSLFNLLGIYSDYRAAQKEYRDLDTTYTAVDSGSGLRRINYDLLLETNGDFVAWLDIPDTPISYPVVYTPSGNDLYLYTTFQGQQATAGAIFIDYRCPDYFSSRVTIIYGHRMNDNTMFAPLKNFLSMDYWENHREVHIYTRTGIEVYNVFSSYTAMLDDEAYAFYFNSDQDFLDWGKSVSGKSNYNTGISLQVDSRVIVLSTCVYAQENNRNVVLAVYDHTLPNP